ncbi:MAG TPA: extracellular solute-binding protein [Clostridiales bacterium]|nr:extracellular solute-binding protein [Clostridiales bacterium]
MNKIKKLIAMLLVLLMAVSMLGACGKSEGSNEGTKDPGNDVAEDITGAADDTQDVEEPEDMAEITLMVMSLGAMGDGKDAVEEGINAITEKEINTHVTLQYVEVGSYSQQLNLAITGNEKVDICLTTPIPASSFSALIAQNQLMPLNDLLPKYAPEALAEVGEYIKGTTINGNIYAIPNYRNLATSYYIIARKDIIDDLGLADAFNNMASWSDYEKILEAIKGKGGISPIANNDVDGNIICFPNGNLDTDSFAGFTTFDNLGDGYKLIGVDADGKVINNFASPQYKAMIERVRSWYEKGYVYKDAATTDQASENLMKANVTASFVKMGELGVETAVKGTSGYDVVIKKLATPLISTGNTTKFDWAIPVCATEPEAAAKFLNLMFTNKDICNLLAWGVEGRDYVVENGVAKYPEGVTADTVAYHTSDFLYGNQFLVYPWEGDPADIRDQQLAELKSAEISPYLGFSCDLTNISNELTAINNVIGEYKPGVESGSVDLKAYDAFVKKLNEAGAEKVVAEYQAQLDAWKAQQ